VTLRDRAIGGSGATIPATFCVAGPVLAAIYPQFYVIAA
jgi:hypothetical protein